MCEYLMQEHESPGSDPRYLCSMDITGLWPMHTGGPLLNGRPCLKVGSDQAGYPAVTSGLRVCTSEHTLTHLCMLHIHIQARKVPDMEASVRNIISISLYLL